MCVCLLVNTTTSSETQAIECENTHSVVSVSHGQVCCQDLFEESIASYMIKKICDLSVVR